MLFILTLFLTYVYFYKIKNLIKAPSFQETNKHKNKDDSKVKERERVHIFAARVLWSDQAFKKFQIL